MSIPFGPIGGIPEPSSGGPIDAWRVEVVRVRTEAGGVDQYKEPLPGVETRVELPPALFQPIPSNERIAAGIHATFTEPTVYWLGGFPDVVFGDVLVIEGDEWLVNERPMRSPIGLVVTVKGTKSKEVV